MARPFRQLVATQTLSPSASSVNADFLAKCAPHVLVTNAGTEAVFARIQSVTGAAAASVADTPILGGQAGILDVPEGVGTGGLRVSVFGTGTVYITPGQGGL